MAERLDNHFDMDAGNHRQCGIRVPQVVEADWGGSFRRLSRDFPERFIGSLDDGTETNDEARSVVAGTRLAGCRRGAWEATS